jgi:hypothetical protein
VLHGCSRPTSLLLLLLLLLTSGLEVELLPAAITSTEEHVEHLERITLQQQQQQAAGSQKLYNKQCMSVWSH